MTEAITASTTASTAAMITCMPPGTRTSLLRKLPSSDSTSTGT